MRFTGRHVGLCTAAMVLGRSDTDRRVGRMLLITSAVTLLASMLLASA